MDKVKLQKYKSNKRELPSVERMITKLKDDLERVPEVSVKVQKSGDDFPYIEEHVTVKASEPKRATALKKRIREKEKRKAELEADIREVEEFIAGLPEGVEKQIFEMVYLDNMTQREAGELIGYSKGRVSQIISGHLKD